MVDVGGVMRKFLYLLGFLVLLALVAGAGLLWALKDPNRFKPELEALILESTGMPIKLDGDLSWELWPPVVLAGNDIKFSDEDSSYLIGSVGVRADVLGLLRTQTLAVQEFVASDLVITDKKFGDITHIDSVRITDFAPGKASPLQLSARLESPDGVQTAVTLRGQLTFFPEQDRLTLAGAQFDYDGIKGVCDARVSNLSRDPSLTYEETKDDLLPLDSFRAYDWVADCTVPRYSTADAPALVLNDVQIHSENKNARSNTSLKIPELFGGSVETKVAIDTRNRTPRWQIQSSGDSLQAEQVTKVLAPKLAWIAPLLANGEFDLRGNTPQALLDSAQGQLKLSADTGTIDISKIKEMVLGLAQLAGEGERVQGWQDQLAYENLNGNWLVKGREQDLNFAIDNLVLKATGQYDPLGDVMDMRGSIQVNEHPTLKALDINPNLYGLEIPLRCTGTVSAPSCGLDSQAAQGALARLAAKRARGKIDEKIDEALEDKVPEEYRDTAKKALKGLGDLLRKKD